MGALKTQDKTRTGDNVQQKSVLATVAMWRR